MKLDARMLILSFPLLVFVFSSLSCLSSFTLAATANNEKSVMDAMAASLRPTPLGWSSGTDYCTWVGVMCDSNNRVTVINLSSKSLSGALPPLNSLSQLTVVSLQKNQLSGPLPSFANLSLLQSINLESNNFSSIPPGAFAGLTSLQTLSLYDNMNLAPWPFPRELTDSSSIVTLSASSSNMFGSIPDIFSSFRGLQDLKLSYNNLTGSLPSSFNGSPVQNLWLNRQNLGLTGSIDMLSGMPLLTQVWLFGNAFIGPIPDLSSCTELFDLQLRDNLLTGVLPPSLMSLRSLKNVSLVNNMFQGPLPEFPTTVLVTLGSPISFCRNVTGDCDPQVTTLLQIASALGYPLKLAEDWSGNDACNQWTSVTCDSSRRVISVNFARRGFSGTISPAFSNLTSLRELYLNDNNLTGSIPESLTSLPQLKIIDISNNNLSGEVPSFRSGVRVVTAGNINIGIHLPTADGSPSSASHPSANKKALGKNAKILIVVLVPTISIVVLLILAIAHKKRKLARESQEDAEDGGNLSQITPDSPIRFTLKDLEIATNNFDEQKKLGKGGFGSVFEGSLSDGTRVAVKRLDHHGQGRKEFLAEVRTIGSIHHVNLVKLVGFCAEKSNRLLVYEHMSNGSLDKWIFNTNSRSCLPWGAKKKIILHIAKGLAYLHDECQKRIAHLDVKPQNVLLDNDYNAKLSDFGLAKLIDRDQSFVMTQMRGTRGYLAPEWLGRKITEKADIYSYGVVVLEVIFGRKNFDCYYPDESIPLINLVKKRVDENKLPDLLDEYRSQDSQQNGEDIEKVVRLAVWCLHSEPLRRPAMSIVVRVLEDSAVILEAISEYQLAVLEIEASSTTQVSASILSGPR